MTVYRPPQRAVGAWVLSIARWIRCTFHLPQVHAFDDYLRQGRAFLPLTDVSIGQGAPLPFLALRASAALAVVPDPPEELLLLEPPRGNVRQVRVYLEHVAVHGTLHLRPGVRTSDFLAYYEGWVGLRGCRIVPPVAGMVEPVPVVLVNAGAIVAVTDEGGGVAIDEAPAG
jgi:hypothetical protein